MDQDLEKIKLSLKKIDVKPVDKPYTIGITKQDEEKMRNQFFDSGAQWWYDLISDLTFSSAFISLPIEDAKFLVNEHLYYMQNKVLANEFFENDLHIKISNIMQMHEWNKVFIKLSTRSPKDSPIIKQRAYDAFQQAYDPNIHTTFEEKIVLFANLLQENFYVDSGKNAVELLVTSERVYEDLQYAFEKESDYEKFQINLVIREWKSPIPLACEFRGFVWKKSLNAIGQYHHIFFFPELQEKANEIKEKLNETFNEKIKPFLPDTLENCIVDFAYLSNGEVKIIELNPFDCIGLASFPGSTGLYNLSVVKDKEVIQNGPLEIRVKEFPTPEKELRKRVSKDWIQTLGEYLK